MLEDEQSFVVVAAEGETPAPFPAGCSTPPPGVSIFQGRRLGRGRRKPGDSRAAVQHLLPRRTSLVRKVAGRETEAQILAANIDVAFIVQALDATFNPRRLERFLVMVHEGGSLPVVVLNKVDLQDDVETRLATARAAAGSAPVLAVSARTRKGLGELRQYLQPGRTCAARVRRHLGRGQVEPDQPALRRSHPGHARRPGR